MFKQTCFNFYNYCAKMFIFINIYLIRILIVIHEIYFFVLGNFSFRLINDFAIYDSTFKNYKICTFSKHVLI